MSYLTHAIEFENTLGQALAKDCLTTLMSAYPGYSWKVDVKGGMLVVHLLDPRLRRPWGMAKKLGSMDYDAGRFTQELRLMAGEFLERANLRRGLNEGERLEHIEGIPQTDIH